MGEIRIMVSRLHQEGFDLEDMIDEELRAAGFLELCERTTRTLLQRAAAVEESHTALRRLLDSIDSQLKDFQGTAKAASSLGSSAVEASSISRDPNEKAKEPLKTVIVIDDDEKEFVDVADMSCQATHEDIRNETQVHSQKVGTTERPPSATQTGQQSTSLVLQQQQTTSTANYNNQQQTTSTEILRGYVPIRPAPEKDSLPSPKLHFSTLQTIPFSAKQNSISKRSDIAESSASSVTKTPPLIYRTLKSPAVSGAPLLPHRVALMPSTPTLPVQQTVPSVKASAVSASPLTPPSNESVIPMPSTSLVQPPTKPTPSVNPATPVTSETTVAKETSVDVGPPEFDVGTRVIGQRADELWYPGVIEKILTDKHNQVKYKVKFDKGTRGLLSSNHISLESNPDPSVLNVGSRVVGIYGKLDVLYAGIVAEKACAENKSRFLVFFDDGFAQYLPVKKLHHVYHTGKKVWNECAEHSKEFIQEYLEEFPNRPMVKLRVNQWVKTEWRGQWLKAKVMQLDCSLIKMLFQIDNRSEWLYRGSTRMEPLYSALVDGKISKAKKKRSRKLTRGSTGKSTEPYIDYSITKPCFGVSPYSKTDPEGEQQHRLEEKRQQTQLEQLRQQEQQEELRDKNKQSPSSTTTSTTTSLTHTSSTSTSTVTSASGTTATPTEPVSTPSTGTTEDRAGEAPKPRPELAGPSESSKGQPSDSGAGGTNTLGNELPPPNFPPVSSTTRSSVPTREDSGGDCQSTTNCTASSGHCSGGGVAEPECNSFGCCTDSSLSSVIQASTARKKTNAGFSDNSVLLQSVMATAGSPQVNAMDRIHRPHGIEVIDLDGDSTTAVLHFPMETDDIMSSLQSHKNEYLVPNADGSILDEIYDAWEAPWLRVNRRDIRSTGCNRAPAFQIPTINRRKQDVASLIEERLKQDKLGKTIIEPSIVPQLPIPVVKAKLAVKGPHKCGPQCISQECIPREEIVKHNPRSVPLLLKWKREIAQRHPGHKKTVYYRTPCNKRLRSMAETASYLTGTSASNVSIDQFTFDPQVSCQDTVFRDVEPIIPDISRGADAVQISVVNEVDTCYPPPIDYVSKRILAEGVNMVLDPGFLACCDCTDNCQDKSKCSCAQLTIQASAAVGGKENASTGYEFRRLKDCVQTGIYECNQNCACGSQCFNRVVQNGIQLRLQVFKTENRGWGLRALDDIPMGTFVCTYAGQILNEDMANKEGRDFGDEYLAELDHIEVVEKAKEGYESSVSDLEEDDSVIYKTLGGESSSTVSASEDSDASSLSGDESSEADSLFSEDSYSSGRNSRHGEGDSINHKPLRKKKRKRSSRKSSKRKRGVAGEESLVVERESKAYCLSNLADEKWCYIALKRSHDNQKEAAAFLRRVLRGEGPEDSSVQAKESGESAAGKYSEKMGSGRLEGDDEDKNMQSSDFDFDDVGETFCQDMRAAMTSQRRMENGGANEPSLSSEKNVDRRKNREAVASHNFDIIDLTSDNEETDGPTCDEFRANGAPISSQQFQVKLEKSEPEKLESEKADNKSTKSVEDENADSAPSLLSAEDLCKLAAKNQHLADEPPILTKMNPTRRLTNTLEDMISRLKGRVWTAPPSSDSSGPSAADGPPADEPLPMDFDQSSGEVPVDKPLTEQFLTVESPSGLTADPISEPSSPEIENMESFPPSPSSLRSDVSKPESLDRKSELSTGSSRRSGGGLSKPPVKKLKVSKPKIHYSRSHPSAKTASVSPSMKASPNTPSPSGPSLSRQSSVSIKRLSTRVMFGEEHCYVIDAKAYGNCGRYLNHSCSPNLFVQNVFVDTHDLRFPWVAFFTQQNVAAGTELTWDYAYEVGSVKGKVLHCYCGSADCRGRLL